MTRIACLKLSMEKFCGIHTTTAEYRSPLSLMDVDTFWNMGNRITKDSPVIRTNRIMAHSQPFQCSSDNNREVVT
ncbi:hypothetical protein D3C74_445130 [compost metagenome]